MHESSGSAWVIFLSAVSQRCSFCWSGMQLGLQISMRYSLGSCPFSIIERMVPLISAIVSQI